MIMARPRVFTVVGICAYSDSIDDDMSWLVTAMETWKLALSKTNEHDCTFTTLDICGLSHVWSVIISRHLDCRLMRTVSRV